MNRTYADLPLHHGHVPRWLAERMSYLGALIVESIVQDYGKSALLKKFSDPFWFQSFGAVLGMDWHSSGITTSVMGSLKSGLRGMEKELGFYICGGRGKHSLKTPQELLQVSSITGLDGGSLVRSSRLSAKVDNTAIQDGFQLYLHCFMVTDKGEWVVVQQGMNNTTGMARRYHWHSKQFQDFLQEPHTAICGNNMGSILNLTHPKALQTKEGILAITRENPDKMLNEIKKLTLPRHHDVQAKDVDLKRLGSVLVAASEAPPETFDTLLLQNGLGPRTLQSLTLISEVIHGTPSRFTDPARFSFALGGKDGYPFPVPTKVYDQTIQTLEKSVSRAKIGHYDKKRAIEGLHKMSKEIELNYKVDSKNIEKKFAKVITGEKNKSFQYGGRTVSGWVNPTISRSGQFKMF